MARLLVLVCSLSLQGSVFAQVDSGRTKTFDGFSAVRNEILALIGASTSRVRIVTDFLTDGEIVSSLYVAQYRKVNVEVLLGQAKATHPLSRLGYLKAQNIPVWLRPRDFMKPYVSILLFDNQMFALDGELNSMAQHRKFSMTSLSSEQVSGFLSAFSQIVETGVSPTPKPIPLVGRAGGAVYGQSKVQGTRSIDSYQYKRVKEKPGQGIPTRLPKTTILQDRARNAEGNSVSE